jgi:hypothetical protein
MEILPALYIRHTTEGEIGLSFVFCPLWNMQWGIRSEVMTSHFGRNVQIDGRRKWPRLFGFTFSTTSTNCILCVAGKRLNRQFGVARRLEVGGLSTVGAFGLAVALIGRGLVHIYSGRSNAVGQ